MQGWFCWPDSWRMRSIWFATSRQAPTQALQQRQNGSSLLPHDTEPLFFSYFFSNISAAITPTSHHGTFLFAQRDSTAQRPSQRSSLPQHLPPKRHKQAPAQATEPFLRWPFCSHTAVVPLRTTATAAATYEEKETHTICHTCILLYDLHVLLNIQAWRELSFSRARLCQYPPRAEAQ